MNESVEIESPGIFTERAVELLKEYHTKLCRTREQLRSYADKATYDKFYYPGRDQVVRAELQAINEWYKRFAPAGQQLAQQVSGMIEHGRLTALERTELQLRLAEFEAELLSLPKLIAVQEAE